MTDIKPFECVGTAREFLYAASLCIQELKARGERLPAVLRDIDSRVNSAELAADSSLLGEFNRVNLIPREFMCAVTEMMDYVSACD